MTVLTKQGQNDFEVRASTSGIPYEYSGKPSHEAIKVKDLIKRIRKMYSLLFFFCYYLISFSLISTF